MLAGGEMQIPAAYYAKKEGYNLIISDMNLNAPCKKYADKFFCVDTVDLKKNKLVEKFKKYTIWYFYNRIRCPLYNKFFC